MKRIHMAMSKSLDKLVSKILFEIFMGKDLKISRQDFINFCIEKVINDGFRFDDVIDYSKGIKNEKM